MNLPDPTPATPADPTPADPTPDPSEPSPPAPADVGRAAHPASRELDSADLFHGAREVLIRHASEVYRLRLTRNGKLILHK